MKECYNLNENYSVWEMEEIADIWYQRLKKIKKLLEIETDKAKIEKAKKIRDELIFILERMFIFIVHAHQHIRPTFPIGGAEVARN